MDVTLIKQTLHEMRPWCYYFLTDLVSNWFQDFCFWIWLFKYQYKNVIYIILIRNITLLPNYYNGVIEAQTVNCTAMQAMLTTWTRTCNVSGTDRINIAQIQDLNDNFPLPYERTNMWSNADIVWIHHGKNDISPKDLALEMSSSGYYRSVLPWLMLDSLWGVFWRYFVILNIYLWSEKCVFTLVFYQTDFDCPYLTNLVKISIDVFFIIIIWTSFKKQCFTNKQLT